MASVEPRFAERWHTLNQSKAMGMRVDKATTAPLSLGQVAQNRRQNLQISVRWRCVEAENLRDERIDVHVFKCRNSRIRPNVRTPGINNGTHALELLRGVA